MIIDYFDSLVQQVDIYTEEELEKYTDKSVVTKIPDDDHSSSDDEESNDEVGNEEKSLLNLFDSWESIKNAYENQTYDEDPYMNEREYEYSGVETKHEPPSVSSNVRQFLNNMRDEMINEIRKGEEEALKNYKNIKSELKIDKLASDEEIDRDVATRLFENKSMFLLLDINSKSKNKDSPFKLYLFVVDFYLNKQERKLLK